VSILQCTCPIAIMLVYLYGDVEPLLSTLSTDLPPSTLPSSGRTLQLEAGSLVSNTPVGVYRHQLRAVREKLRLEVARSDQLLAEARLAKEQLKAETEARHMIQVDTAE